MSFTLWCSSSSLEAIEPYPDGFHPNRKRAPLPKAFVRPVRQDELRKHGHDAAHKAAMVSSSNLVPEGLREMSKSDKKWGEETNYNVKCIRTLLIDNYDSYTYNIYQELSVINKVPPVVVRNDEWTWEEACFYLYEERAFDNIVISPGPGSPMCVSDIGLCLQLLRKCTDIPILGVCLGHQRTPLSLRCNRVGCWFISPGSCLRTWCSNSTCSRTNTWTPEELDTNDILHCKTFQDTKSL